MLSKLMRGMALYRNMLTIAADVRRMVNVVVEKWDKLDIAVNNAGRTIWSDTVETSEEDWDKVMDLNLKAVFLCAQAEARVMIPQKYGKIINTASMSGSVVNKPQNQAIHPRQESYISQKALPPNGPRMASG